MKKIVACFLVLLILTGLSTVLADKARFLISDKNAFYHSEHLTLHLGSNNCKVSGNYITVRDAPGSNKALGHVEQSDAFTLVNIDGSWALIEVTYHAPTSPDSCVGLFGWINADYVECPCSKDEYYNDTAHTYYQIGETIQKTVNLRETPSKSSRSLAKIGIGQRVEVLSEYAETNDKKLWYRIRWNSKVGFVRNDMVKIIVKVQEPTVSTSTDTPTQTINIAPTLTDEPIIVTSTPITVSTDIPKQITSVPTNTPVVVTKMPFSPTPMPTSTSTPGSTLAAEPLLTETNDSSTLTQNGRSQSSSSEDTWMDTYRKLIMEDGYLSSDWTYYLDSHDDKAPIAFALFFNRTNPVPSILAFNGGDTADTSRYYIYTWINDTLQFLPLLPSERVDFYIYPMNYQYSGLFVGIFNDSKYSTTYYPLNNDALTVTEISSLDLSQGYYSVPTNLVDDPLYRQSIQAEGRYIVQMMTLNEIKALDSWDMFMGASFWKPAQN